MLPVGLHRKRLTWAHLALYVFLVTVSWLGVGGFLYAIYLVLGSL